jgi:hypothetical protein
VSLRRSVHELTKTTTAGRPVQLQEPSLFVRLEGKKLAGLVAGILLLAAPPVIDATRANQQEGLDDQPFSCLSG